ncbi:rhodanese-like domain-containing protein [Phytoactinopolyspora mesophila]|uniref:Rhodanese-like domain-containing protein n=1 Tax=Phytoactinopolyspora mesophila TaxID=2650750 RepID=A0A7K3M0R4_9ACTN|nr:rhodanese-like domain-containing protein [Phytoactinopolyspora mesophila]NDL56038.1 rhodanese-like domain-containing protein [Phytoactinopolyspora mesophila]
MNVAEVSVNDIPEDAPLVDVREDAEWQAGHAPNAVHVPMSQLPARLEDIPDDAPLYIICKVGGRSAQVAAWLNSMGREAVNVADGMASWADAGKPMVSETEHPPFVA